MKAYITIWPDVELDLSESDYTDLKRAGLVLDKTVPDTKTDNKQDSTTASALLESK